ncbi:MAG TPA: hypothetical protein VGH38_08635, partial [Bryobacteraceae bacterium]
MVHVITSLRPAASPIHSAPRSRQATPGTTTSSEASTTGASDFRSLFTLKANTETSTPPTPAAPASTDPPTAESVFGPNPWISNPTGTGPGGTYSFNPYYFATAQTAAKVAQMVGGVVVQSNQFTGSGGPFQQQQPNYMVQMPDGHMINPGLV